MNQSHLIWLSKPHMIWLSEQKLTGEQIRVLFKLLSKIDVENRVTTKIKDIAAEMGINPQQVSRSLRALREKDIIYKDPNNDKIYKLNPHIGNRGVEYYNDIVAEFERVKQTRARKKRSPN